MNTLVVGGPLNMTVSEETSPVVWHGNKPAYFHRVIRNRGRSETIYLHKSLLRSPPEIEPIIRKIVFSGECEKATNVSVVGYYWWSVGDLMRYNLARLLS